MVAMTGRDWEQLSRSVRPGVCMLTLPGLTHPPGDEAMKHRNSRIRKPDPLLLLALLVVLGVVVTTTAHAESTTGAVEPAGTLQDAGAWLVLNPVKNLAERLDLHWLSATLERPAIGELLTKMRSGLGKPFGEKGPEFNMSWRPQLNAPAELGGDSGGADLSTEHPGIYFSLRRSW